MYNINLVRVLGFDLACNVPELFTPNNGPSCLVGVPFNYYLKNIDSLESYCKRALKALNPNAEIHIINDFSLEPSIVGGYYELGDDYHIIINPNANECWRRFGHIKELCSLYINHYGRKKGIELIHQCKDYQLSLESSVAQKALIDKNQLDKEDLDSDTFAIFLAAEIMIPPKIRKHTNTLLERERAGEIKMNDIAQSLSMPEYMLQKLVDLNYYTEACEFYELEKQRVLVS